MLKILPTPAPWQMNFRITDHQSNFLGNAPMWISNTSLNCSAALKPIALFGKCKVAAVKNDKGQPRQTCRSRYLYDPYGQNSPGCYGLDGTNTTYNDVSTRRSKHTNCVKLQSLQMFLVPLMILACPLDPQLPRLLGSPCEAVLQSAL